MLKNRRIKKVLIVQPYGIGDLLFVTPVLRALKKTAGAEKTVLLLGSRTEAVVSSNPYVDEIYSIDKDVWHRQGKWKAFTDLAGLTRKMRREKFDLMLDYSLRGEYAFLAKFFWGIPLRAGFDYKRRGFFHNCKLPIPGGFSGRHVADFFCDLAEKAGIPVPDRRMEFFPSGEDEKKAGTLLASKKIGRFLVLSVGGGESWGQDAHFKRWPPHFFADLASRLIERYRLEGAVVVGSKGERELASEFCAKFKGLCLNLCGEIPLGVSAALIRRAALFLGNDGGLMHLAHALETPVIALFGPVDPVVYGPFPLSEKAVVLVKKDLECRPCYKNFRYNGSCEHRNCLQNFTPAEAISGLVEQKFKI